MTPISKPALSIGRVVALVILSAIALSIAWYYRAEHGFRDLGIFVVVMLIGVWALKHDWHGTDKGRT